MSATLNGQLLGRTHYATRAVLERELTRLGLTFGQSLLLNVLAAADGPLPRVEAARKLTEALKLSAEAAHATLAELVAATLVAPLAEDASQVTVTPAGRQTQRLVAAASGEIGERLWAGLPADDLAAAARVLEVVRRRAEASLASAA
ncbi:hypothetical protein SAMN05443287_10259 [Micromonospora phaseoli]|uniref:DNA-binding transcriptional regulator, MarR family n=1 Tax=Micromonospora phaseoli TaxID=1144548 RepID=A0A1H6UCJ9_9ACTN|nr:hypothetical protein [Micromonospora phaseoli]PZV98824.1 hypothetical protein CLV64_10460 [Micromonospora phaseoli]GIJ76425.1 hypothetical protein Xph01_08570 [Micromonospora phaseoli]SEI85920.1 hypothetical protein SAMN05443287_10259 [Micromonospora phaseoli]